jgi:hypothetical protein
MAQLEAKNAQGQPFQVQKVYNCVGNGRGINAFLKDYELWTGAALSETELCNEFDANEVVKGKPVLVEISHRKNGKVKEAWIKGFLPA